jgi:hypothetical protein
VSFEGEEEENMGFSGCLWSIMLIGFCCVTISAIGAAIGVSRAGREICIESLYSLYGALWKRVWVWFWR